MHLMLSDYIALLGCILLGALLTLGTLSRHRGLNALAYFAAALVFAVHILDSFYDYLWVWLIPHPAVVMPMLAAVWGALIAVLAGLARYIKVQRDRRALYVICALLVVYGIYSVGCQLVDPGTAKQSQWNDDVLIQSTVTTCIAAACCTYLRVHGVDLEEHEAVARGLISHNGGTQTQAWRILRLSLPTQYDVRISPLTLERMRRSGRWFVASVGYNLATGHAVVVKVIGDYVLIRDPLIGEYDLPVEEFEQMWLGVGIWAEETGRGTTAGKHR